MQKYEIMYLFSPKISEKQIQAEIAQANNIINKLQGKIEKEDFWGLKELAYPIKNFNQGYYDVTRFELAKSKLEKLEQRLKPLNNLLRFLITVPEEKEFATQPKRDTQKQVVQKKQAPKEAVPKTKAVPPQEEAPKSKEEKTSHPTPKTKRKEKAELQDLDKKLDEILGEEVL